MWSIIQAAGWPIWPLIVASIIALALIFERLWSLRQSVVAPANLVDQVLAEFRQAGATPELLQNKSDQFFKIGSHRLGVQVQQSVAADAKMRSAGFGSDEIHDSMVEDEQPKPVTLPLGNGAQGEGR